MRAPRFVPTSLYLTLGLAACGKTGAVRPPPPAAPAPNGAVAEPPPNRTWVTPPPIDVSAPPADAEREPSGVARKILARGTGTVRASLATDVDLRYAGWERNGRQFEGTNASGEPRRYDLSDFAQGMADEVTQMVEGDKRRIWVPSALAYGKRTNFANAPKGDMTFEIELVRVIPLPPAPADLKAPPADAKTTKSGLAYVVLKKGTGKAHLTEDQHANVIYHAWSPDGHMFENSYMAGDVARIQVKKLPPGWREAMLHMVEGDRWRLWLPGKLAFGDLQPGQERMPFGPPPGPVVFEVELIKILE